MKPKFVHDYEDCKFLGHWYNHDVWLHHREGDCGSILARYGNEPWEYASSPIEDCFGPEMYYKERRIGLSDGTAMPYFEYIFSGRCIPSTRAMILGLLTNYTFLAENYSRLCKKVSHGCTEALCEECDKEQADA
jgi:hypothetical protein